ncbi:hypothetical protein DPMN_006115 [Dreissena polymorpha]|uniref:Uncharacterized protein n=1 Tax=Dreissena polymorpha TaxID=45954 RepID=A0A9D4MRE6_DREPO|nr:hypothetical protein DPMN_006115 [Dreissena polymorpha]
MKGSAVSKSSNICTSTLICIRPAGAPTSGLKGSAVFNNSVLQEILSTSRFHFCLAGTPGVIAVVLVTLTASLQQLRPFNNRCCLEFTALGLALSLSTAAAAETTKKQLYNRLSCQLGPDTQGHFLRMGGGGWLSAKDFWAVQRVLLAECSQSKHGAPHFPGQDYLIQIVDW